MRSGYEGEEQLGLSSRFVGGGKKLMKRGGGECSSEHPKARLFNEFKIRRSIVEIRSKKFQSTWPGFRCFPTFQKLIKITVPVPWTWLAVKPEID